MDKLFIDCDVIIDFLADRQPFSIPAAEIFSLAELNKIKIYTSSLCFSNIFYVLRKLKNHRKAIELLKQLERLIDIIKVDKEIITLAMNSEFSDFEDAIQNYSALKLKGMQIIVTRNIEDYKKSELSVMLPEDYLRSR